MRDNEGKDLGHWARPRLRIDGSTNDCIVSPGRTRRAGCDKSGSDTNPFTKQNVSFPAGRNLRGIRWTACSRSVLGIPQCMRGNIDWLCWKPGAHKMDDITPKQYKANFSFLKQKLGDCFFEWKWKSVEPQIHPTCSSCGMHRTN